MNGLEHSHALPQRSGGLWIRHMISSIVSHRQDDVVTSLHQVWAAYLTMIDRPFNSMFCIDGGILPVCML